MSSKKAESSHSSARNGATTESRDQKRSLDDLEVLDTSELPLLKHPRGEPNGSGLPYLSEQDIALTSASFHELEDISLPIIEETPLFLIIGEVQLSFIGQNSK